MQYEYEFIGVRIIVYGAVLRAHHLSIFLTQQAGEKLPVQPKSRNKYFRSGRILRILPLPCCRYSDI